MLRKDTKNCELKRERERERERERFWYRCGPLSLISSQILLRAQLSVVCEWSNNGQAAPRKKKGHGAIKRQSWRWLSRKRKRYEKTRCDSRKWQCDMCDGRNWKGWNCANCDWGGWKTAGHARDTPQILPPHDVAEDQDTEMLNCNPCLTETRRTEALTIPTPKAAPIGARLDSALARQARARRAYETARKMLNMAKQRMEETTTEMERADAAVENAKKKVGPATGMASDVVTLLNMLKPHSNTLSSEVADLVARIEGEMKAAKANEENSTEEKKTEALEDQQEEPKKPMTDAQEIASQLQALEAMRMAEAEDEERLRVAQIEAGKKARISPSSLRKASTTQPTMSRNKDRVPRCLRVHPRPPQYPL